MTDEIPTNGVRISPQDILAMLAFEAQRIVSAAQQHAAGFPFPPPTQMKEVITRMANLNETLIYYNIGSEQKATDVEMKAQLN